MNKQFIPNNFSISFQEFLSFMVVYSTGSSTDKLKLIFNMYDYDRSGEQMFIVACRFISQILPSLVHLHFCVHLAIIQ